MSTITLDHPGSKIEEVMELARQSNGPVVIADAKGRAIAAMVVFEGLNEDEIVDRATAMLDLAEARERLAYPAQVPVPYRSPRRKGFFAFLRRKG